MSMFCLNWIKRSLVSDTAPSLIPWNSTPKRCSKSCRQGLEVIAVHGEGVGVTVVTNDLLAIPGNVSVGRAGPPSLDRTANHYHGPVVGGVPVLHGLEGSYHLIVIISVVQCQDIPAIGGPLVLYPVSLVLRPDHAAHQLVIDASVVIGKKDSQPLADLLRHRLGFHLLGVAGCQGEFTLDGQNLEAVPAPPLCPRTRPCRRRLLFRFPRVLH